MTCNTHRDKASSSAARRGTWRNNHWQHSVSKEQPQPHQRHTVKTEGNPFSLSSSLVPGKPADALESGNFCGLYLTLHLPLANSMCTNRVDFHLSHSNSFLTLCLHGKESTEDDANKTVQEHFTSLQTFLHVKSFPQNYVSP